MSGHFKDQLIMMKMLTAVQSDAKILLRLLPISAKCSKNHLLALPDVRGLDTMVMSSRDPRHHVHVQHYRHQRLPLQLSNVFLTNSNCVQAGKNSVYLHKASIQQRQFSSFTSSYEYKFSNNDITEIVHATNWPWKAERHSLLCNTVNFKSASQLYCMRHHHTLCGFYQLSRNSEMYLLARNSAVNLCKSAKISIDPMSNSVALVRYYRGQRKQRISGSNTQKQSFSSDDEGDDEYDEHSESDGEDVPSRRLPSVDVQKSGDMEFAEKPLPSEIANAGEGNKEQAVIDAKRSVDDLSLPELSRVAFNIVPYVKRSETLQKLVRLGVNLDKVQRVKGMAELLIKSNFDRDIVPYIRFLSLVGVGVENIGDIITVNPRLLTEEIQDLEMRVGYLLHRGFSLQDVATIYTKAPVSLLMDAWMLEEKLRFYHEVFGLTEEEVRQVVTHYPKLLPRRKELIADVRFHVKEFLGFNHEELKQLILKQPKIFFSGKHKLVINFDYLHNTMLIPHDQILVWPGILLKRLFIFKNRHLFLLSRNRAQYDPCQENFISLRALGSDTDEEFCHKVAKCDVQEFYDFCKTL